jgi:hypothetical protein
MFTYPVFLLVMEGVMDAPMGGVNLLCMRRVKSVTSTLRPSVPQWRS